MNEEKTEIKKLIFTVNGHDHIVSIDEAKKLHEALHELFANKTETIWYPVYRERYFDRWTPMWSTKAADGVGINISGTYSTTDTLKFCLE